VQQFLVVLLLLFLQFLLYCQLDLA
jgi:hypothetical protein